MIGDEFSAFFGRESVFRPNSAAKSSLRITMIAIAANTLYLGTWPQKPKLLGFLLWRTVAVLAKCGEAEAWWRTTTWGCPDGTFVVQT